ncbi:MAG: hypothetical protein IKW90_15740 [Lachnospiraceae bacterium]|nr:hypothetical protein [Lachnospiraceae bacterium]
MGKAILYYILFLVLLAVPIINTINYLINNFIFKKDNKTPPKHIQKLIALIVTSILFIMLSLLPLNEMDNIRNKRIKDEQPTYQTIVIDGTEYELVPKGE